MKDLVIKVKCPKKNREGQFTVKFAENTTEDIKEYGDATVHSHFEDSCVIWMQGRARGLMEKDTPDAEIQKILSGMKPGVVTRAAIDPVAAFMGSFASKTPDEQKALMQKIAALATGAKAAPAGK